MAEANYTIEAICKNCAKVDEYTFLAGQEVTGSQECKRCGLKLLEASKYLNSKATGKVSKI